MTKIRSSDSSAISDRRGGGGGGLGGGLGGLGSVLGRGGGKAGGGLLGIIILLAAIFLPKILGGGGQSAVDTGSQSADVADGTCSSELEQIVCGATNDVQDYWSRALPASLGTNYAATDLVFFNGGIDTACGQASSQMGPFYCPGDRLVYIDLEFLQQLENELVGNTSDLAEQYIVAHEFGHHIQNVLGTSAKVDAQRNGPDANKYSVALELQADCYAGAWAGDTFRAGQLDSADEVNEALEAAAGVGDDYIQGRSGGSVDPDSFTHGTSEQRQKWFKLGYDTVDPAQCAGTFAEEGVSL